jgi:hypothetical protein
MKTNLIKSLNGFYNEAYKQLSKHKYLNQDLIVDKSIFIANESASKVFQITNPNDFMLFVSISEEWSKETKKFNHEKIIEKDKQRKFNLITNG